MTSNDDDELEVISDDADSIDNLEGEDRSVVIPEISYSVSSFGADPEVETLVNRMNRGDIIIPAFQRGYVWKLPEASRFIESLLLGLPVPGLFLAKQQRRDENGELVPEQIVIDGQQRLKTLQYFYSGYFHQGPDDTTKREFALTHVQERFEGKTYKTLERADRIRLDTTTIHATTVQQNSPAEDDTSLYHIFERLNSGGQRLNDHEMRLALYHGPLIDAIKEMNEIDAWRRIYGRINPRLKDHDLILRFLTLYEDLDDYRQPLNEFMNRFALENRHPSRKKLASWKRLFTDALTIFLQALDSRPFRPKSGLNVSVYDSCMVAMAKRLASNKNKKVDLEKAKQAYTKLFEDEQYVEAVTHGTGHPTQMRMRMAKAAEAFAEV